MARRNLLRSGAILTIGSVAAAACSFIRNLIITRMISVQDMGIAATFAMTMAMIEMAGNLGLDRLLVQAEDGDEPRLQATAQAFQVFRGLISASILFVVAGPVSVFFRIPEVVWAFRVIALVPLIRSFTHLDIFRVQRQMRFGPSVLAHLGPLVLVTVLAAPLAMWLGDYRVLLYLSLTQISVSTLLSHLIADRRYDWAWDGADLREMVRFGWPLLINGFLMFVILQGDIAIIGRWFSMEELGWYSVAFSFTLLPSIIVGKVLQSFLMPLLARVQLDREEFNRRAVPILQVCQLAGVMVGVGFAIAGAATLVLVYGEKYQSAGVVVGWLGVMQAARIAKAGPAVVAISLGDTKNPTFANLFRMTGLIAAVLFAVSGWGIYWIAISGLAGEILGFVASVWMVKTRLGCMVGPAVRSGLLCFVAVAVVFMINVVWLDSLVKWQVLQVVLGVVASAAVPLVLLQFFPHAKAMARSALRLGKPAVALRSSVDNPACNGD